MGIEFLGKAAPIHIPRHIVLQFTPGVDQGNIAGAAMG